MSEDFNEIHIMEQQIYDYISDPEDNEQEISELFHKIDSSYDSLTRHSDESKIPYSYMQFLIRYILDYSKDTFFYVEQVLEEQWIENIANSDFPKEIMESVFKAYKLGHFQNPGMFFRCGKKLIENERFETAIAIYSTFEDIISHEDDWNNWSTCHGHREEFKTCIDILTRGLKTIPDSMLLLCNYGFYLYKTRKNSKALDALEQALSVGEKLKYSSYHLYRYAANLKANIYRELNMPLNAYIEYSRLSAAGDSKREELQESAQDMLGFVERL